MAQLIAVFLGATAWVGGVLVIVVSWHRIVSDDPRLLNLLTQVCDPAAPVEDALDPVAALFGPG